MIRNISELVYSDQGTRTPPAEFVGLWRTTRPAGALVVKPLDLTDRTRRIDTDTDRKIEHDAQIQIHDSQIQIEHDDRSKQTDAER